MKTIKKLIIIISIMIIILIGVLVFLTTKNKDARKEENTLIINEINEEEIFTDFDSIPYEPEIQTEWSIVNLSSDYWTIYSIYNSYINMLGEKNYKNLYNVLSPDYINEFNITEENIGDQINIPLLENSYQSYRPVITQMIYAQTAEDKEFYMVKGNVRRTEPSEIFQVSIMVGIDKVNKLYTIYPEQYINNKGYNRINVNTKLNIEFKDITENEYNKYKYIIKQDNEMAREYFQDWKEIIQYYPEYAYQMLDPEYSAKRFGSYDEFAKYLELNKNTIALATINKYKRLSNINYIEYICSDKYNNIYRFRQQGGIMKYTTFLDNYTIMSDQENNAYKNGNNEYKTNICLTKLRDMINSKDYNAIYTRLNEVFKNNNFKNIDDLKNYINNNLYDLNKIIINENNNDNAEYSIINCTVSNYLDDNEKKEMIVIIKLLDEDFEFSFSVKNIEEQ